MSVDVFGHQLELGKAGGARGPPGEGFKISSDGQYDMKGKRLCLIADPIDEQDAVSQGSMQREIHRLEEIIMTHSRNINQLSERVTTLLNGLEVFETPLAEGSELPPTVNMA